MVKKKILFGFIAVAAILVVALFIAQYRSNQSLIHVEGEVYIPRPVADVWIYNMLFSESCTRRLGGVYIL